MKNYIVTSEEVVGEIEIRYDDRGLFYGIIIRAELEPTTLHWVVSNIPITASKINVWQQHFTVLEVPNDISFEAFWHNWPEEKIDRKRAENVWKRMSLKDKTRAIWVLGAYKRYCQRNPYKSPKSPAAWLNEKKYENDYNKMR
ncbi:MAG: hypothetical protein ACK4EY_16280 [Flavipsychrobacter sp.]